MYRLTVETLLGLQLEGDHLRLEPCVPAEWDNYKIHYRFRDTIYHIAVKRLGEPSGQVTSVTLDGADCSDKRIPLVDDRAEHFVEVELGSVKSAQTGAAKGTAPGGNSAALHCRQ